jgi:perosamine synthetase
LFFNSEVAFKYKMSSMQAALGLAQLERIEELVARKREIFSWYREELTGLEGVRLNHEAADTKNSYWMVTVVLDETYDLPKVALLERLSSEGIDARPFFFPLSSIPAYAKMGGPAVWRPKNPISYRISAQAINLPSALNIGRRDVQRVCEALKRCLATSRRTSGR